MKGFHKTYFTLLFLICIDTVCSQTVSWKQQLSWDAAELFGDNLLKVEQQKKWGLANFDGTIVMPCSYDLLTEIHEDHFLVLGKNGQLLMIGDPSGKTTQVYGEWYVDNAWPHFTHGLLAVRNAQDMWGYMDTSGRITIKAKYKNAFPFFFGFASVCENERKGWHIINPKGTPLVATDGTMRQKNFSFASSFTMIDKHPRAMVLVSDKMYFIDGLGNITNDIISSGGASVSNMKTGGLFECVDGNLFMEIEVDEVVGIVSIKKGGDKHQYHQSNAEKYSYPKVHGIDIESTGAIKVGELTIRPQFQEAIALTNEKMLVKKDGKWSLLEFNLEEQSLKVDLSKSPSIQKICHNTLLAFQLIGKQENTCAYTMDESGNLSFWNIDPMTGNFNAPFHHLNGSSEAVAIVGLETNGVLLEPTTFSKRITIGEGFKVTGPTEVSVASSGKASFELVIWNNSEQDAAPFEVIVDNGATGHFDGLKPQQSVKIPVNKYVKIPALEDYTNKTMRIKVSEKGMPERTYKVTIKFSKPSKKG